MAITERMLDCGHTVRAATWKTREELRCPFLCDLYDEAAEREWTTAQPLSRPALAEMHEARRKDQQETIARHRARGERS
jgi:hypothetical protein